MARRKVSELIEAEQKYENLVWYERSHRVDHTKTSPKEVVDKILAARQSVEAKYPKEVAALAIDSDGHANPYLTGVNLGMLKALRWAQGQDDGLGDT